MSRIPMLAIGLAAVAGSMMARTAHGQHSSAQRADRTSAKRSELLAPTTGLAIGVYVLDAPGVSISGGDVEGTFHTGMGQGLGVSLDYGLNQQFSLFGSIDIAKQHTTQDTYPDGEFGLGHFELGLRINLRISDPKTVPYLSGSIGARALAANVKDLDTGERFDWGLSGGMVS